MDDKQLEERLNLLKTSYDRVRSNIDLDEIINKIEIEKNKPLKERKNNASNWQKVTVWAVSLASVFVIGILSASLFQNDDKITSEMVYTEQDIEKLEQDFAIEKQKRQQELEMKDKEFSQLGFVEYADSIFSSQISPGTLEGKNDGLYISDAYDKAIKGLKLPSEMIEDVKKNERLNAQDSMQFVDDFITKTNFLIAHYDKVLFKHKDEVMKAKINGKISEHRLIAMRKSMPDDVQKMLKVIPKQGLKIIVNYQNEFQVSYDTLSYQNDISSLLDEYASNYIALQEATLLLDERGSSKNNPYYQAWYLQGIEKTLLNTGEKYAIHSKFENYYFEMAKNLLVASGNKEILSENNQISIQYRQAWEVLANTPGESPLSAFMKPLVASMKASNWEYNQTYKRLNIERLRDYYLQALNGDLSISKLEWAALLPEEQITSLEFAITNNGIDELYKIFNENFDSEKLHGIGPIEITLLYDYADQKNNHEMMWELMSSSFKNNNDRESFIEQPFITNIIGDSAKNLYFNKHKSSFEKNVSKTVLGQEKGGKVLFNLELRLDEDDIWRMNAEESSADTETTVDADFLQRIHALYKSFAANHDQTVLNDATPEEIVALYYYCSLMEDYETKYELYIKDDSYVQIPKEEYMSAPKLKITDIRKEFSSLHFEQRSDKEGYVIITMSPERTIHLEEQVVGFSIIQTENGWRAAFMPTQ